MNATARAVAIGLLIAGMVPVLPLLSAPAAALDWIGDQTFGGAQTYNGDQITLWGNLTITGTLTFTGVDLTLACPANGSYTIEVRSGATFSVLSGSRIHSLDPAYRFCFIVRSGATFRMDGSVLENCGYAGGTQERRGLALQSSGASVTQSDIKNNCNGLVVMGQSSPTINENDITDNDQSGVWIDNGCSPLIDRNIISGNQRMVGNAGASSAGIFGAACSAVITNNTINRNLDLSSRAYGSGIRIVASASTGSPVIMFNDITWHNDSSSWGIYLDNCNAYVYKNNITNNGNGCFFGKGSSQVDSNRIQDNNLQTMPVTGYGIRDGGHSSYSLNYITRSATGVWLTDSSLSLLADCTIANNLVSGLNGDATTVTFSTTFQNCTFRDNTADVLFDSAVTTTVGGTAFFVNTTFDPAKAIITDTDAYLKVSWNMRVIVTVETGGVAAAGAKVKVFDKKGAEQFTHLADAGGLTPWMLLEQKTQSYKDNVTRIPYNVTGDKGGLLNWTPVNLDSSRVVAVILDDTWPGLTVDDPANGTIINRTYANITGTTSPFSTVYVNGVSAQKLGGGDWRAPVNLTREGPNEFRIRSNDGGRNEVFQNLTVVRDLTAPVITIVSPIDRLVTNRTPVTFMGNVSETSGVTTINGDEITVRPDGSFTVELDISEGDNTVLIECRDAVWNVGSLQRTVTLDRAAPELRVTEPGTNITTNASIMVIQGLTEFNASMTMNGQFLKVTDNEWTISVGLVEGENLFLFVARDQAGNVNTVTVRVVRDTTPPPLLIVSPKDNSVTNSSTVEIRGYAEVDAVVKVNGVLAQVTGADFKAQVKLDRQGRNTVRVEAWDALNNRAELSIYLNLDTVKPALKVNSPLNNQLTNSKQIELRGQTEVGATLTINDRPVMISENGVFAVMMGLNDEGPNTFEVLASDPAGNVAAYVLTVFRDTEILHSVTTPKEGMKFKTNTVLVIGSSEANCTVKVNDKVVSLRPDKTFISEVPLVKGRNVITVVFQDKAGNTAVVTVNVTREVEKPPEKGFIPGFTTALTVAAAVLTLGAAGRLWRKRY